MVDENDTTDTTLYYVLPAIIIAIFIITILSIKLFNYLTLGMCKSNKRLDGKTVILTGCTSGIGKETARELARRGARLIMACRNVEAATKLKDEFISETGNTNIVVRKLDLASYECVREFADKINQEEERLDILIHNAGCVNFWKRVVTNDGIESVMQTNMYSPFLLTHLLIDLLKRSAPSRIIIVSSETYLVGWLPLNNPNPTEIFYPAWTYPISKYSEIVFTLEAAQRLQGTNVTINTLHPGVIFTDIWMSGGKLTWLFFSIIVRPFCKTVIEGIQTTLYLAVSDDVEGVSGRHFLDCRERKLYRDVSNRAKAQKFWKICQTMTKLQPTDPQI